MTLPVVYLPEAQDDIDAAYAYYEQCLAGLGDRFLEALRDCVSRIADAPEMYGIVYQDIRAAPLRRFPYVVYYRVEPDRILVIAVQHGRRSWKGWQGRT
ncbi:MAG: type II toxin-antitoxin system RelE/ParE family toxin [Gemmataceae bacterium]|nr:type II toxin-antitoxin system RelE/ParE family toxin [Gemmataceae bacterium]